MPNHKKRYVIVITSELDLEKGVIPVVRKEMGQGNIALFKTEEKAATWARHTSDFDDEMFDYAFVPVHIEEWRLKEIEDERRTDIIRVLRDIQPMMDDDINEVLRKNLENHMGYIDSEDIKIAREELFMNK